MKFSLFEKVIELSISNTWEKAKEEWKITKIEYLTNSYETCLCDHFPIREVIIFTNTFNKNKINIGNCCVNKFFENKNYNKVFKAIKKNKINKFMIEEIYSLKIINIKDYNFALNVWRKRSLSEKQQLWFNSIKNKIISYYKHG